MTPLMLIFVAHWKMNDLRHALDAAGRIYVHEYRMDTKAKAGMLYLKPENEIRV